MELNELKSAWSKHSSVEANRYQVNEAGLHDMLKKRTGTLIDRINRNVSIGFILMAVLTIAFFIDDFILSPLFAKSNGLSIPFWVTLVDILKTVLILVTFTLFGIKYRKVKKGFCHGNDLRIVLKSLIRLIKTYKRLFYWIMSAILLIISVSYITGMFTGLEISAFRYGVGIEDLDRSQVVWQIIIGMLVIFAIMAIVFFFFRWIFRKLYGKYIAQLQETLRELEEPEESFLSGL